MNFNVGYLFLLLCNMTDDVSLLYRVDNKKGSTENIWRTAWKFEVVFFRGVEKGSWQVR